MAEDKNETHYFLDGNPEELERLQLGQSVIKACMRKLVFAPVDLDKPGLQILDSATADSVWLRDVRNSIALSTREKDMFVGTDITNTYFPRPPPEGITLLTQSMTQPWPQEWASRFDLVHQRMALPAASKTVVLDALRAFVDLVKPGGWIQLVEPDHSIALGPAMADFFRLLSDVFKFMGTGPDYAPQLKKWLTDLGVEDVKEEIFDVPIGKTSPSDELCAQSARMIELVIKGLTQVAGSIHTSFSAEELHQLGPRIQEEVLEKGGVFRLHCVWGRRSLSEPRPAGY
ncbi:putative methyltransferase SirN-like protein [Melanomma pulvis-pyrius CBS 109.77]|uniref:Putative methyltransferase SirN-like protein n=1 Tax=Melanomma pulvis-pyrius CBS 109.77 TaxID=1314802 RepID=A0A6A6WZH9_9PLEO|nr:putative methyltransferase SirN-like protein [Melanomma pulvis-pyrius CBS 109.77]